MWWTIPGKRQSHFAAEVVALGEADYSRKVMGSCGGFTMYKAELGGWCIDCWAIVVLVG